MVPPELLKLLNPFSGGGGVTVIEQIILWAGAYVYFAYTLQIIALKVNAERAWMAWIPIASFYLMCKMTGRPEWWIFLMMIPLVKVVILIILWMEITNKRLGVGWPGILAVIPVINIGFSGYLAFSE